MLPYSYRVTKYDPADRDEHGNYTGAEESVSDHGPVEAAYLRAVADFAEDTGIHQLTIREPEITGFVHFGREPAVEHHGLAGLFPPDLAGFHDGAQVSVAVGLELVRAMLRDNGAWCRLEVEDSFAVHIGWDQYLYICTAAPCEKALSRTRALGLFPERIEASPYDAAFDDEPGEQRPADDIFWARLRWCIATHRAVVLEEGYLGGASRWHRLTSDAVDAVRAGLTPRAQLTVWPDLSTDVAEILAALPAEGTIELVWEDEHGQITSTIADETQFTELAAHVTGARAATALSLYTDERRPLFTGVLPDNDGILRARWRTEPAPSDHDWAFLKALRRGQIRNGAVSEITDRGVAFVEIGGFTAILDIPELPSRPAADPSEILTVGQEITAQILDIDMVRERVTLSLEAPQDPPDPSGSCLDPIDDSGRR